MLIPEKVVKVGTWWDRVKIYYNRHPIICAYAGITACCVVSLAYRQYHVKNKHLQCVAKYRRQYIVIRPDDPQVTMIKSGPIGLDY